MSWYCRLSTQTKYHGKLIKVATSRKRGYSEVQTFKTEKGQIKVPLKSGKTIGVAQSRGERPYQEDTFAIGSLSIPISNLRLNLKDSDNKVALAWRSRDEDGESDHDVEQVLYAGVFDGHGTDQVSHLLRNTLHDTLEKAKAEQVKKVVKTYRSIGGYLRRFDGGNLKPFNKDLGPVRENEKCLGLDQMATLAFLLADEEVIQDDRIEKSGSTATITLIHSLDDVPAPHYSSKRLSVTLAHVGDTRAILCNSFNGRVEPLTEAHHPDSRVESERLRVVGTGLVTDSFGEARWGGALANTRAIGDQSFKRMGVTGEPDIIKRVINGEDWAFMILMSDGISGIISDQEIADLCRNKVDPTKAAQAIVNFAEEIGSDDNMTCIVIPFAGWKKLGGNDTTLARREFRIRNAAGSSRSRRQ